MPAAPGAPMQRIQHCGGDVLRPTLMDRQSTLPDALAPSLSHTLGPCCAVQPPAGQLVPEFERMQPPTETAQSSVATQPLPGQASPQLHRHEHTWTDSEMDEFVSSLLATSPQPHAEAADAFSSSSADASLGASTEASTAFLLPSAPPSPPEGSPSSAMPLLHKMYIHLWTGFKTDFKLVSGLVQLLALFQLAHKRACIADRENLMAEVVVRVFSVAFVAFRMITSVCLPNSSTVVSAWLVHNPRTLFCPGCECLSPPSAPRLVPDTGHCGPAPDLRPGPLTLKVASFHFAHSGLSRRSCSPSRFSPSTCPCPRRVWCGRLRASSRPTTSTQLLE